jgi:hypothetical protein
MTGAARRPGGGDLSATSVQARRHVIGTARDPSRPSDGPVAGVHRQGRRAGPARPTRHRRYPFRATGRRSGRRRPTVVEIRRNRAGLGSQDGACRSTRNGPPAPMKRPDRSKRVGKTGFFRRTGIGRNGSVTRSRGSPRKHDLARHGPPRRSRRSWYSHQGQAGREGQRSAVSRSPARGPVRYAP